MNTFIRFVFHLLPDWFLEEINAVSLDELDERVLIVWAKDVEKTNNSLT